MGSEHVSAFWSGGHRYEDLAQEYERGITITHPTAVSGRRIGCPACHHCFWCASAVNYYEYRGPRI